MTDTELTFNLTKPMVPANDAEKLILDLVTPVDGLEMVSVENSLRRVLGQPISSPLDFPHWDNSAMDGYAVRYDDVATLRGFEPRLPP